jgi:hypothetical protein
MQARMQQMSRLAVFAGALVVVVGTTALAQSSNPEVGIWKVNVAKSTITQGAGPKSATMKIEAAGAGVKMINDGVDAADGTVRHWESTANYDGKDNPVTGNPPNGSDMVARSRLNATTTKAVNKKGGKIISTQTRVMSGDGKTLTTTATDAAGQPANVAVLVWEKQ